MATPVGMPAPICISVAKSGIAAYGEPGKSAPIREPRVIPRHPEEAPRWRVMNSLETRIWKSVARTMDDMMRRAYLKESARPLLSPDKASAGPFIPQTIAKRIKEAPRNPRVVESRSLPIALTPCRGISFGVVSDGLKKGTYVFSYSSPSS